MSKCKWCGADLEWVNREGKPPAPVDAEPVFVELLDHGDAYLLDDGTEITGREVSLGAVVQVIFIFAKLARMADWSWWEVLIPTWFYIARLAVAAVAWIACKKIEGG